MTIDAFGKKTWGTKSEESWHKFIDAGFLKTNGEVKAKYLANGTFDEDGNILDLKAVREFFANLEEDDDEEEEAAPKAVAKKPAKDADDDDSGIEVDIDTLFTVLNDFKFESREQIGELMDVLVDKMVHFDSPAKAVKSEPVEEEDESDDEPDPNREGKYRGWTITIDGRKVVATKRGKSLTCSVKSGNIRELINEEEG